MPHASYTSNGDLYCVEKVTDHSEVATDVLMILADAEIENVDEYSARMHEAIDQGLAYHIKKNGATVGIMYNRVHEGKYEGSCIYCKNDTVGMMILLKTMFEINDAHKIYVMPYKGSIKYFLSLATEASIKAYHVKEAPLVIVKNTIVPKGTRAFRYLEIEEL
jgi:hypothetical protein